MIGLDTNVLVRYLTRDDEAQYQLAFDLIAGNETFFILS
jgi:predicted nucleic-acid-binding protein